MTIETKFNIGDEVWFIWENKVQSAKIDSLWGITGNPEKSVIYQLNMKWNEALYYLRNMDFSHQRRITKEFVVMGAIIAKQPNGLYCRYSSIVDNITHHNMTEEDYIELCVERAKAEAKEILEKAKPFKEERVI